MSALIKIGYVEQLAAVIGQINIVARCPGKKWLIKCRHGRQLGQPLRLIDELAAQRGVYPAHTDVGEVFVAIPRIVVDHAAILQGDHHEQRKEESDRHELHRQQGELPAAPMGRKMAESGGHGDPREESSGQ